MTPELWFAIICCVGSALGGVAVMSWRAGKLQQQFDGVRDTQKAHGKKIDALDVKFDNAVVLINGRLDGLNAESNKRFNSLSQAIVERQPECARRGQQLENHSRRLVRLEKGN